MYQPTTPPQTVSRHKMERPLRVGLVQNIRYSEVAHQLCNMHLGDKWEGKSLMCNLKRILRLAESGRGDRRRQREDKRSKPKLESLKPRALQ